MVSVKPDVPPSLSHATPQEVSPSALSLAELALLRSSWDAIWPSVHVNPNAPLLSSSSPRKKPFV